MTINAHVSDLFFNLDHSQEEKPRAKDDFNGYDRAKLLAQADWFIITLAGAGLVLPHTVTPEAMVQDFEKRL